MPLYAITTQTGVLSDDGKAALAAQLTELHCKMSGVQRNWVHIVFHDYPPGSGFTAGEPAATAALYLADSHGQDSGIQTRVIAATMAFAPKRYRRTR